ncbi:hypothetical protein QBC40DRAFT_289514 [Triangularia verruculosa]|uniref:Uncharacterized protein n=1 Tax=Triangularia verruculosa TaxID=2587418 RepID=A0AAN6XAQ5_9PEZI|nr:hypothetical protein QBC40DRAFT_289514 [Triangularia verruculosa]
MLLRLKNAYLSVYAMFRAAGITQPVNLVSVRRTVEVGRSGWHSDLDHFEATISSRTPITITQAETVSYKLVTLLRDSCRFEGSYEADADSIQRQFEFTSRTKLLEQHKSVGICRKKVYRWRDALRDLHTKLAATAMSGTQKQMGLMTLMAQAWSVYVAVCNEVNGHKLYNSLQLFCLTFMSYMLIRSSWIIAFIGFGIAASCCENAYMFYMEYQAANLKEIIRLLEDSMNEVPGLYKRAQSVERHIAWELKNGCILPSSLLDFITSACNILREPTKAQRKSRMNEMVPKWIELLGPSNRPDLRSSSDADMRMCNLMNDIADLLWLDCPETPRWGS